MNHFIRESSNYDKHPLMPVTGYEQDCWEGWENIGAELVKQCAELNQKKTIVTVEVYTGVLKKKYKQHLRRVCIPAIPFHLSR